MQGLPELGMLPHPVAVAANRDQVAVVDEPIDQGRRHDVVTKDSPHSSKPLFEVSTVEACS